MVSQVPEGIPSVCETLITEEATEIMVGLETIIQMSGVVADSVASNTAVRDRDSVISSHP